MSPPVAIVGGLRDTSGYADEARGFLRALEGAGHAPGAHDLKWSKRIAEMHAAERVQLERQLKRGANAAPLLMHCYPVFAGQPAVAMRPNVARTMFETDRIPAAWLKPILERDEVWVPGEFNVESFQRGGVPASRLHVVGGTLDFGLFAPGAAPLDLGTEPGRFVFLSNFEFQERKGWRQLLDAWTEAFGPDDPVTLVLKVGSWHTRDDEVRRRLDAELDRSARRVGRPAAPVVLLPRSLSIDEMPGLYAAADAYVLPTRGEGWGRPFMEAMAMGLPTIASRWGGQLEFMEPETTWLVEGRTVEVDDPGGPFATLDRGHRWFEPDVEHLAATLREIADRPEDAAARAAGARGRLIERFGPEVIAARVMELAARAGESYAKRNGGRALCVVRGRFGASDSLSLVNEQLSSALEDAGHAVNVRALGSAPLTSTEPSISHGWPPDFERGSAGPALAILPWEYGAPPRAWVDAALHRLDRVIVPSAYVRDGFVAGGMPPGIVEVVPNGVDLDRFHPDGPAFELERRAATTFLFVGGTIARKGIDVLVTAWQRAFAPGDDVQLVVKDFGAGTHYASAVSQLRAVAASGQCAPLTVLDEHLPPDALPALYRAADVMVTPYRAEGFCLPALEALACGLPVIHTGEGPTREFVPEEAGWSLPAERVVLGPSVDEGRIELSGDGWWHEPDVDALVDALRDAADPAARSPRAAAARPAAERLGWDAAARTLEGVLQRVRDEALPLAREGVRTEIADARGTVVTHVPDWDGDHWADVVHAWATSVPADADVSLALPVPEGRDEEILSRVLGALTARGVDLEAMPDIILARHDGPPAGLVASADAILLDAEQAAERPARLVRRAMRTLTAGELAAFASGLPVATAV